jgi:hypothetical protein
MTYASLSLGVAKLGTIENLDLEWKYGKIKNYSKS